MLFKKCNFLKNYFYLLFITYLIIISTKFIFVFYLDNLYLEFSFLNISKSIFLGYKFDLAISSFIAFILFIFNFNKLLFSFISSTILTGILLLQLSDILYFKESSRHIAYEIFDSFTDANSLFMTAFTQNRTFTILTIILSVILFIILFKLLNKFNIIKLNKFYFLKFFTLFIITIFFLRGMIQGIPLNPWQSNQIGNNILASANLNASYNVLYAIANKNKELKNIDIPKVSNDMIKKSFKNLYNTNTNNIKLPLIKTKPNVVFLFLESWSAKYIKPYGYKYNTTPNFNKLLTNSIRPKMMIAGGHRTTEGLFCSMTSFQNPLGKTIAKTQLQDNKYRSIIDILNENSYTSAFFQGTLKETSGTGSLAQKLGYKFSYGKKDIKTRLYKENSWGIHDIDLYNFVESKLPNIKEPFVIGINGATTHDEQIPNKIKKINFVENTNLNNQLNALHFSDYALGKFIQNIEIKYPNTIFVMFADHAGGHIKGTLENYQIPFAIYSKKLITAKYYDTYLSQRDISPTIYDLIIVNNKKENFSGKSLISDNNFFADYYHNGILGFIQNNKLVEINIANNKMKCFTVKEFKKLKVQCNNSYELIRNNALSFTNISQKLLFNNNLNEFKKH